MQACAIFETLNVYSVSRAHSYRGHKLLRCTQYVYGPEQVFHWAWHPTASASNAKWRVEIDLLQRYGVSAISQCMYYAEYCGSNMAMKHLGDRLTLVRIGTLQAQRYLPQGTCSASA